jgi:hypothetical protein
MSTHNVEVNVTANTAGAQRSLSYLQSLMGEFGKQATNRFAALLGAAAVAKMAFDKVSQAISANIATAKQVSQMAIKFNIDPVAMHSITMAAKDAGVSVRALTMAMKQLGQYAGKAMTSREGLANFKQLGIEADKLNEIQKAPSKFLPEIAKALMEIGDENQRSAAGATLLGRQYQMLLPLIEELGTSAEAREKFLANENAMTAEQIAANKEIAKMQNEMSDGFDKMVASVAPLLLWAMNFVNFLAKSLGIIKDMIFETDEAKKERFEGAVSGVAKRVEAYQSGLRARQEAGTLSDEEKAGIAGAGSLEEYVSTQLKSAQAQFLIKNLERPNITAAGPGTGTNLDFVEKGALVANAQVEAFSYGLFDSRKKAKDLAKAHALYNETGLTNVSKEFSEATGFFDTNEIKNLSNEERTGIMTKPKAAEHYIDILEAQSAGSLDKLVRQISTEGASKASADASGRKATAEEARVKKDMAMAIGFRQSAATLVGDVYDPASDKSYSKGEYAELLKSRGVGKEDIAAKIRAFEKEEDRVKREKQMEAAERKLETSERKLYVGDASEGKYRQGLDEAEKAEEALKDAQRAQFGPLKDLQEQKGVMDDLEMEHINAFNKALDGQVNAEADLLRIKTQMEVEQIKLYDLQSKANDLKAQEVASEEALKAAKESVYRLELKRGDEVYARIRAEQDHEKQLKYKVMKVEGQSQRDISQERLKDEEAEYGKMLDRYNKKYNEAMTNEAKGLKGEYLSEKEIKDLEGLTKELDAKKRGILDTAFDLGSQGDKGQVTSMRRIGGGGMEYGGLANTAKESLEVQKKMLAALEGRTGYNANPILQQVQGEKQGRTYGEAVTASDGSPR